MFIFFLPTPAFSTPSIATGSEVTAPPQAGGTSTENVEFGSGVDLDALDSLMSELEEHEAEERDLVCTIFCDAWCVCVCVCFF